MDSFKDSLAYWSTILSTAIEILGVHESSRWIIILGILLMAGSIVIIFYAWSERRRLKSAAVTIGGRRIDSLNLANLTRRLNRTLVVQEAEQVATINGDDLVVTWRYAGYCRADRETSVEFSIDMDTHLPFDRLDCVAYDLRHDPRRAHAIRPVLLGSDGLSKKVAVPLLEPVSARDSFAVLLRCTLPGCMKSGVDYYTSTASLTQPTIPTYTVRLVFLGERPDWLRVYECDSAGATTVLKDLRPSHSDWRMTEYVDLATNMPGQSARIYVFHRNSHGGTRVAKRVATNPTPVT